MAKKKLPLIPPKSYFYHCPQDGDLRTNFSDLGPPGLEAYFLPSVNYSLLLVTVLAQWCNDLHCCVKARRTWV